MQTILKATPTRVVLYSVSRANFGTHTLSHSLNPNRNNQLRVMSTPEWPVPYYQREYRAPPVYVDIPITLEKKKIEPSDKDVLYAKEALRAKGKGYIVEAVENHFPLKSKYSVICRLRYSI